MTKERDRKTNAIRVLDAARIDYRSWFFETPIALSGVESARRLGIDQDRVFKTLVTQGRSGGYYVFMIPAGRELSLKKAAATTGEKSIAMIKALELLPLTGYVHGGCSPIGMKKLFPTFIDETALLHERIVFSGGRIGCQVEVSLEDLRGIVPIKAADLTIT